MICFLRTSAAGFDIRLKKYIQACEKTDTPYMAITWNRLSNATPMLNELSFQHAAPYGYGHRMRNFLQLILWCLFAIRLLIVHRKKYKVIHACNVETMPVAFIIHLLLHKKVIFDIYDTSGHANLERFFILHSNLLIIPHRKRLEQEYTDEEEIQNLLVIENVPVFDKERVSNEKMTQVNQIVLSYVGTFQRNIRGLENILQLVQDDDRFILEIAGSGDDFENDLLEASKKCSRIHFHGAVKYDKALDIMNNSDFIYAQYFLKAPVHKYASPNKYYESLFLGVPILTTENTLVGSQVIDGNTGYAIGEEYKDLANMFKCIDELFLKDYHKKEKRAKEIWSSHYSSYFQEQMVNHYIKYCRCLANK